LCESDDSPVLSLDQAWSGKRQRWRPQFIALCEASGASPQAALRGMAAMLCGLRYDEDDRLVPLEGNAA
jgi:hypothetical protein